MITNDAIISKNFLNAEIKLCYLNAELEVDFLNYKTINVILA